MNNKTTAQRTSFIFGLSWLIVLACLVGSFFIDFEKIILFQIILGFILVLIISVYYFGGYNYIEIEVEKKTGLNFRYYNLFPIGRKFKLYQIPIKNLDRFEIRNYFGGFFSFIYLYEKSRKGIARYPGIGLSAVPKSRQKYISSYLEKFLNNY